MSGDKPLLFSLYVIFITLWFITVQFFIVKLITLQDEFPNIATENGGEKNYDKSGVSVL